MIPLRTPSIPLPQTTLPRRSSAGKIKRSGPGYSKYFKEKAYKKAIVTFGDDITDDIPSVST
jgi:hypothetical protein